MTFLNIIIALMMVEIMVSGHGIIHFDFQLVFQSCESKVIALRYNKVFVDKITSGQLAGILLDQTCFYAEQGGQIYDEGFIVKKGNDVSYLIQLN